MPFRVPEAELEVRATRAGGPGGQHVNTSATRVEVVWSVADSPSLTAAQRARLRERLGPKLDRAGRLRVVAASHRSQRRNLTEAIARLQDLVTDALRVPKRRKPTKPSRASVEERLRDKRRRAGRKRDRRPPAPDE